MSQTALTTWLPVLTILAVAMAVVLVVWFAFWRPLRSARRRIIDQDRELARLQGQLRALSAGAAGMAGALARVEQQLRRVGDRQQELELRSPGEQLYEHALQLIRDGADAEELMNRCGLVRDEAELLLRMHRYRQTG